MGILSSCCGRRKSAGIHQATAVNKHSPPPLQLTATSNPVMFGMDRDRSPSHSRPARPQVQVELPSWPASSAAAPSPSTRPSRLRSSTAATPPNPSRHISPQAGKSQAVGPDKRRQSPRLSRMQSSSSSSASSQGSYSQGSLRPVVGDDEDVEAAGQEADMMLQKALALARSKPAR